MGPLANPRRLDAMAGFVADAREHGADVRTGGERIGNQGFFFEPTVLSEVPTNAEIMNEEPFGPVALINPMASADAIIEEANRLPYGLAMSERQLFVLVPQQWLPVVQERFCTSGPEPGVA